MRAFLRRLASRFGSSVDRDLRDELEFHRQRLEADLRDRGVPASDAARDSRRAMGNTTLALEDAREVWIVRWVDQAWRDVRYGWRVLWREPALALTAIATLAIGIATTTTVFSVADAELWKPLPYPDANRLVGIWTTPPAPHAPADGLSGAEVREWREAATSFSDIAAEGSTSRVIVQFETARSVLVERVTANYLALLGRPAIAGRTLSDQDAHGTSAAVLTARSAVTLFGSPAAAVGRTFVLDNHRSTVVGVVETDDSLEPDPDIFVPLDETAAGFRDWTKPSAWTVIARLRSGATVPAAQAELSAIAARIGRAHPQRAGHIVHMQGLREYFTGGYDRRPFALFLGAAAIVLALACLNVAGLLLARAFRRSGEFAIRGALGGGSGTLGRQLVVEGALIAVPAGALGILLTTWSVGFLRTRLPYEYVLRGTSIPMDLRVGAVALAVTAATAIVFGLVPALFARKLDLSGMLAGTGRTAGRSPRHARMRRLLVGSQIALTFVLVAAAGLFVRSFVALSHAPLGFDHRDRVSVRVQLAGTSAVDDAALRGAGERLLERAGTYPGVASAAIGSSSPLDSGYLIWFRRHDRPTQPGHEPAAVFRAISPGFFRTLGIPLLAGRSFTAADVDTAPRVAIINETLARRVFGTANPIGGTIDLLPGARVETIRRRPGSVRIVGVAGDAKEVGPAGVPFNDIYLPFPQAPTTSVEILAATSVPVTTIAAGFRTALASVDPTLAVLSEQTLDERVSRAFRGERFNLLVVGWFAAVAILLAAVGIGGMVSYSVQERTKEFGVRLALGARPAAIVRAALDAGVRVALVGSAAGLAGALLLARIIGNALYLVPTEHAGMLYGVRTTDPFALGGAFVILLLITLGAAFVPARRVTRLDPLAALRE